MPHIVIKLWPGRTMEQKRAVCIPIGVALHEATGIELSHISVSIEEVQPEEWDGKIRNGELIQKASEIVIPEGTSAEDWQ